MGANPERSRGAWLLVLIPPRSVTIYVENLRIREHLRQVMRTARPKENRVAEEKHDTQNPVDSEASQAGLLPAVQSPVPDWETLEESTRTAVQATPGAADGAPRDRKRDREQGGLRA